MRDEMMKPSWVSVLFSSLSLSLSLMDPEAPGNYITNVQDWATPLISLENPLVSRLEGFWI